MKKIWTSKTFWVNLVSGSVLIYNAFTGRMENPTTVVAAVLPWINILLRTVTKEPIVWSEEE